MLFHLGFKTWREAEVETKDRVSWRRLIDGKLVLVLYRESEYDLFGICRCNLATCSTK